MATAMQRALQEMQSEAIELVVGTGVASKTFKVPKDILCKKSTWFAKALKDGTFTEGRIKRITLPEDTPEIVEAFVYWVHFDALEFDLTDKNADLRATQMVFLFELWTFGDRYLLPNIQNTAMLRLLLLMDDSDYKEVQRLPSSVMTDCYNIGKDHAVLRLIVADYVVARLHADGEGFTIDGGLATAQGFMQALHASEAALHQLPKGDFPRLLKPQKFVDTFCAAAQEEGADDDHPITWCGTWRPTIEHNCDECGFSFGDEVAPRCRRCRALRCEQSCDAQDFIMLCEICTGAGEDG